MSLISRTVKQSYAKYAHATRRVMAGDVETQQEVRREIRSQVRSMAVVMDEERLVHELNQATEFINMCVIQAPWNSKTGNHTVELRPDMTAKTVELLTAEEFIVRMDTKAETEIASAIGCKIRNTSSNTL